MKYDSFTNKEKEKIENKFENINSNIINRIEDENDKYINRVKKEIKEFINNNTDSLNYIISDLNMLISKYILKLEKLFDKAFNSSLNKISYDINNNIILTNDYFNNITKLVKNDSYILEILKTIKERWPSNLKCDNPKYCWYFSHFDDKILLKNITQGYLIKYNLFKNNCEYSDNYLKNQLNQELLNLYNEPLVDLNKALGSIKNIKILNKYKDFIELKFLKNHNKNINNIKKRINKFLSNDIYNNKYINSISQFKNNEIQKIIDIKNKIDKLHNEIFINYNLTEKNHDYCIHFSRKETYICTCASNYNVQYIDNYCIPFSNIHENLMYISIYKDKDFNIIEFNNEFNSFYSLINEKINNYNLKINLLENHIINIEEEMANIDLEFSFKNDINFIISQKYGEELINNTYNYYNKINEETFINIFNNISFKWEDFFDSLKLEINSNLDLFRNSINEFSYMASIYHPIITNNLIKEYFNSIIINQKNDFNYTISYYYNYLINLINSSHIYILNRLPNYKNELYPLIQKRKNEINYFFNDLTNNMTISENIILNLSNQINILHIEEKDFLNDSNILINCTLETNNSISKSIDKLFKINNYKNNDEYSPISKIYLELIENKKQIEQFYEPIDKGYFINLNIDNFNILFTNYFKFDYLEIINQINILLNNINLESENNYLKIKENFTYILEKQINKFITIENIENTINNLYKNEIKEINDTMEQYITENIKDILDIIKMHISKETTRIENTAVSYCNEFATINNTIKQYKENVFIKFNKTVFDILNDFYNNIINIVYNKYFENGLNNYIKVIKKYTSSYKEYKLLNSSYNISEIINDISEELTNEYKEIILEEINYYHNIKENKFFNYDNIKQLIYNELDISYEHNLYPALTKFAIYNKEIYGYSEYDFNNDIKNDIETTINTKILNISNILNIIKGNNYNISIDDWDIINYDSIEFNMILKTINNNFEEFILSETNKEKQQLNIDLNNILNMNFNRTLNYFIQSFGKKFFERIIQYNENFKILDLFNNIKNTLNQSFYYYNYLLEYEDINIIPSDLKKKLSNLNNLDLFIENKNKILLNLTENVINEFIKQTKNYIINYYISKIDNDIYIKLSFDKIIYNIIKNNLNNSIITFENDYINLLNQNVKEKLILSFKELIFNQETEIKSIIKYQKIFLNSQLHDISMVDSNEINKNLNETINNTLNSIEKYNKHFNSFEISDELLNYLNNYGNNYIKPSFKGITLILNEISKNNVIENLEINSQNFETNFIKYDFINYTNSTYLYFKDNYFDKIDNYIESYGLNDYPNKLNEEINKLKRRRRLDEFYSNNNKIPNKQINDIFNKLFNISEKNKLFINNLKQFHEFNKTIDKYIKNLNVAYHDSAKIIEENNYEESINNTLNYKLFYLNKITSNYYSKINESYYNLKDYLINSINKIDTKINKCFNYTFDTLINEYNKILNQIEPTNSEYSKFVEEISPIYYYFSPEDTKYNIKAELQNLKHYAKFNFGLEFDKNDKNKFKLIANIINRSIPKNLIIDIFSEFGNCGRKGIILETEFNNAEYSMNVDYILIQMI